MSVNSLNIKELKVDFQPDKNEEQSCEDWNDTEQGPHVELVGHQEMEEEAEATEYEEDEEDEMKDEPGDDEFNVEVDPTHHQEDVGEEPEEVSSEGCSQGSVGLLEGEQLGDTPDGAGGDQDEDQD